MLDLDLNRIVQHVVHVLTAGAQPDSPQNCTSIGRLPNGIQIFPGSVPLYRGSTLIGGIGISGDGIDQDDLVAFYGASRVLEAKVTGGASALTEIPDAIEFMYEQLSLEDLIKEDEIQ